MPEETTQPMTYSGAINDFKMDEAHLNKMGLNADYTPKEDYVPPEKLDYDARITETFIPEAETEEEETTEVDNKVETKTEAEVKSEENKNTEGKEISKEETKPEDDNKKEDFTCEATWKALTRQMFRNYAAAEVYAMVMKALEEASDKQWFENKYKNVPKNFWNEDKFNYPGTSKRKTVVKLNDKRRRVRNLINKNVKITDVAKSYGLKVKNKMAICPFHEDKKMSLSFSDEKNVFNCFGCGAKGDIIEFVRRMEEMKNG